MDLAAETRDAILRRMRREASDAGRLARYRAEQLLDLAGADADREAIAAAAATRYSRMDDVEREALVLYTIEYRDGEKPDAARHLDPTTIPPRRRETEMATAPLTEEQRERVLAICRRHFEEDPKAKPGPAYNEVIDAGFDVSYGNFTTTYWYPTRDELGLGKSKKAKAGANGTKPQAKPAPKVEAKPKPKAEAKTAPAAPTETTLPPPIPRGPEGLQLRRQPSGLYRIEFYAELFEPDAYLVAAVITDAMKQVVDA